MKFNLQVQGQTGPVNIKLVSILAHYIGQITNMCLEFLKTMWIEFDAFIFIIR